MPVGQWDTPIPLDVPEAEQVAIREAILLLEKHGYLSLALASIDTSDPAAILRFHLEPRWERMDAEIRHGASLMPVGGDIALPELLKVNKEMQRKELVAYLQMLTDMQVAWMALRDDHPFFGELDERLATIRDTLTTERMQKLADVQRRLLRRYDG